MTTQKKPPAIDPRQAHLLPGGKSPYAGVPKIRESFLDEQGRPSLLALLAFHAEVHEAVQKIPVEMLETTELELERRIRKEVEGGKFPRTMALLKISFWDEYRRAEEQETLMRMENVTWGICHPDWWTKHVLLNPLHLGWLIKPPTSEKVLQKELLDLAMKKLRITLSKPITHPVKIKEYDPETKKFNVRYEKRVNVQLVKEIHAIVKTMQDRLYGSTIQRARIESKNLNVNVDANQKLPPTGGAVDEIKFDEVNFTIEELDQVENQLAKLQASIVKAEAKKAGMKAAEHITDGVYIEGEEGGANA